MHVRIHVFWCVHSFERDRCACSTTGAVREILALWQKATVCLRVVLCVVLCIGSPRNQARRESARNPVGACIVLRPGVVIVRVHIPPPYGSLQCVRKTFAAICTYGHVAEFQTLKRFGTPQKDKTRTARPEHAEHLIHIYGGIDCIRDVARVENVVEIKNSDYKRRPRYMNVCINNNGCTLTQKR